MPGNQQIFEKAMSAGHSAAWDQQWEQAAGHYRTALEQFPDHTGALTNLGLALFEMSDFDTALKVYQRVARLNPEDPISQEKMARIFERQGRLSEAIRAGMQSAELHLKARDVEKSIENWIRVTSLQPENLTAHTRLAMIYERLGKKSEAVNEFLASASLLQLSGNPQKATQVVLYALKMLPGSAEATQALHLLKTGQPLPKPVRPPGGTGPVRMAEVRQLEAPADPDQPAQLDPISEARQRALVQLAGLLFDQAEEISAPGGPPGRRGISSLTRGTAGTPSDQPDQTRILLHLGQAIESQTAGQDAQAATELSRAEEAGFSQPALFYDLGLLLADKDETKALRSLARSVKHPDFALGSYLLMGKIYYKSANYSEAANAYLQALRLADAETVSPGERDELRQLYEPIIEAQTHVTDQNAFKAICDTISSNLLRADWRNFLIRARQQLPPQPEGSPPIPLSEMLLESRSGQVIEALGNIRTLSGKGKVATAMEEAYQAIDFAPTYLPLHVQIADLLLQDGRVNDALDKYLLIAQLYGLRGEASQAIQLLQRIANIATMDLTVRDRLIELLTEQGRIDEAIQQYLEVADIYYRLAELDMTRQTYLAALRLVQQSTRNRQWAYQILSSLADIDMQRLDWRQALRFYEQMRTLQPDDQTVRSRIIELNFKLGQDKTAFSELDSYINLLESRHQRDNALAFITGILFEQPGKFELRRRLADLYLRDQKAAEAIAELDAIADGYVDIGDVESAIQTVEEIIRLNPPNKDEYEIALVQLRSHQ